MAFPNQASLADLCSLDALHAHIAEGAALINALARGL